MEGQNNSRHRKRNQAFAQCLSLWFVSSSFPSKNKRKKEKRKKRKRNLDKVCQKTLKLEMQDYSENGKKEEKRN